MIGLSERLRRSLRARRETILLLTIIALFVSRPFFGDTGLGAVAFSLSILTVALAAMLSLHVDDRAGEREEHRARRRTPIFVGWALAIPAVAERVWMYYAPSRYVILPGAVIWFGFFAFVTWSQIRSLLRQREVTSESISTSISIYLLLGMCWALLYIVIYTRNAESFNLQFAPGTSEQHVFPIFVYFSLTCLSTIGFGDITPLTLAARYAAVAEGIAGQFYLAIIVSRLVSMQIATIKGGSPNVPQGDRSAGNTDQSP